MAVLFMANTVYAEENAAASVQQNAVVSQNIPYTDCTKMFDINKEKLFYSTIGAINANKFKIDEIQTENGYIIFVVGRNKYIATVAGIDKDNSILKITPCNNVYYFQPGIISNIYKYIDLSKDTEIK